VITGSDCHAWRAAEHGIDTGVHHVKEVDASALATADLYVFSTPGRVGKPIRRMRRFLRSLQLPAGTKVAVVTTEMRPGTAQEDPHQRVAPIMDELLGDHGFDLVAEERVFVTGLKGPLEDGWETKVDDLVDKVVAAIGPS